MNILHFSDHSDPNLLQYFTNAQALFTTGDLTLYDFEPIKSVLSHIPAFGVYGNHCVNGYMESLGITNVHLKTVQWNGLTIGGFNGCKRYKPVGDFQYTEEEATQMLAQFPRVDILLLHAAPWGLLDTPGDTVHEGSHAVREYVERTQPRYIFCGHDSPSGELVYNGTQIYRTHGARLIEIKTV